MCYHLDAVTPGWLQHSEGEQDPPAVPVIGMLEYCGVTVRAENKEAVERIEREACSLFPHCKISERGVGFRPPNKTCVTPEEQGHASPPSPARARFHQTTLRM
ncbi:unnamed protein product [Pleuronectes platessa]|uniref:Uncharacterized protein n=1 Tax=Pleuronectes platessa TaxID=8262 RepID=A0A9N7YSG0_PLEPL|nr:unnamed protein product [Pleuronectes platessa]